MVFNQQTVHHNKWKIDCLPRLEKKDEAGIRFRDEPHLKLELKVGAQGSSKILEDSSPTNSPLFLLFIFCCLSFPFLWTIFFSVLELHQPLSSSFSILYSLYPFHETVSMPQVLTFPCILSHLHDEISSWHQS